MRSAALIIAFSSLLAGPTLAMAQTGPAAASSHFAPAPPPPGMDDPGINPAEAVSTPPAPSKPRGEVSPAEISPTRLAGKAPVIRDPAHPDGAPAEPDSDVKTTQQGENTVQEYRRGGQVYMVVITPRHGPPQTYYVQPRTAATVNGGSNVQPPMYTLFNWGKPQQPAPVDQADDGQ